MACLCLLLDTSLHTTKNNKELYEMDTFAAYQSDESDSTSSKSSSKALSNREGGKVGSLSLLNTYSDDENSSIEDKTDIEKESPIQRGIKKQKLDADYDNIKAGRNDVSGSKRLPSQAHFESESKDSFSALIHFSKDYTQLLPPLPQTPPDSEKYNRLTDKLEDMYQRFYPKESPSSNQIEKESFASNLRSKKEFRNPHMFTSIVAHFGIYEHGSNIPYGEGCTEISHGEMKHSWKKFEYIDRLLAAETLSQQRSSNLMMTEQSDLATNP